VRTREDVRRVAQLRRDGLGLNAIARATGVPVGTVHRWLAGRPPRFEDPEASTCTACGHPVHEPARLDWWAYAYLLGLYLGDGHVAAFPRADCLRIYLDSAYPRIVSECAEAMAQLMPRNRVGVVPRGSCTVVQCYSRQWRCLLPQHGPGPKHLRTIELADWQRSITEAHAARLVRGLIHSDGSRFTNTVRQRGREYTYPSYSFSNRSENIKAILCAHLDLMGIAWRRAGRFTISIARREAVTRLDEFVGPKQ
jgi:hypothetical protein